MIIIDEQKYISIVSEIVNTKDTNSVVSKYLKDRIYYYSVLHDISDIDSPNRGIVKRWAKDKKLGQAYIREQAASFKEYISPAQPKTDYYSILGVSPDASKEEIRKSWTRLMKDYHPDVIGDRGLEMSRKINDAYSVLKDEGKRKQFDEKRTPRIGVKVRSYKKLDTEIFKKPAALVFGILVLVVLYFSISGGNEQKGINNFTTSDLKREKSVNESDKLLDQIENIKPLSKKVTPREELADSSEILQEKESENTVSPDEEKTEIPPAEPVNKNEIDKELAALQEAEIPPLTKPSVKNDQEKETEKKSASLNKTAEVESAAPEAKSIAREPTSTSLYKFVSDYVTAYKKMDIDEISSLFLRDAKENGMPLKETLEKYSRNFESNDILKYDLKINSTRIEQASGYVDSSFNIVFQKMGSSEIKSTNGKITWDLVWSDSNWKIKNIDYSIYETKSMDDPYRRQ